PWRATMHPSEPAEIGELVGGKIPTVGLPDQRVFNGKSERRRRAGGSGRAFPRIASPRPKTPVQVTNARPLVWCCLPGFEGVDELRVCVIRIREVLDVVVHQRIVGLPGQFLMQLTSGSEWNLHD